MMFTKSNHTMILWTLPGECHEPNSVDLRTQRKPTYIACSSYIAGYMVGHPLSSTVQVISVWRAEICGLVYVAQLYSTSARLPLPMTDASLRQTPLISVTAEASQ